MANIINANGLQVQTMQELVTYYTTQYQAIYGSDINLDSDSPDGQLMMIFIQSILDLQDLLVAIYNQFDPDLAIGATLDQRAAINGIQRQAGTYTTTNITIVTTQSCNLYGLDQSVQEIYTVQDNSGNKWFLITSIVISSATTTVALFRAENPGANLTIPNTITTPVTVVLGVSTVNNPTAYATLGINEESDATLKIRRQKSVSLASQGYLSGLLASLENINGITTAIVYENVTGSTNGDGVPGHSIWVIVAGSYANVDVANAIYRKRNGGGGMYGAVSYTITQVDGSSFNVYWDVVVAEDLYIEFNATSLDGVNPPLTAEITDGIVANFIPGVYESVNINELATIVQAIDPNTLVTGAGFSLSGGGPFTNTLIPSAKNKQFSISSGNIAITVV